MLLTHAVTQVACTWDVQANSVVADGLMRKSAGLGANLVFLQELFETPYFAAR